MKPISSRWLGLLSWIGGLLGLAAPAMADPGEAAGNRLAYLTETDPFYPGLNFPRLTTPQWIGEPGVEAVVILAIDDLRTPGKYVSFLEPILDRLAKIDGRRPVSIFCNALEAGDPQFQAWLQAGLSLEVHTLSHPCPILGKVAFTNAADTFYGGISILNAIPGNHAVAFRTPCCDSINSPSPRLFAELFNVPGPHGEFLTIDSSVMNIPTDADPELPREWVRDADGRGKYRKYLPFPAFQTTIENYPYPYVLAGGLGWEFPAAVPSDWEAFHLHGASNAVTVADWRSNLDATVRKQGVFTMIFHPHGWMDSRELAGLVDYADRKYGKRVKFLNFREAQERLDRALLAGRPLRAADGGDNGVRLLDLNGDGFLDVVIGNERGLVTRIWEPGAGRWRETSFPTPLVRADAAGRRHEAGVRFGVVTPDGRPVALLRNETTAGAWRFDGREWVAQPELLRGLELDGEPILTTRGGRDRGVRLRDVDGDGIGELIVGNESQNAVFAWSAERGSWRRLPYALPGAARLVDADGRDQGLRFVDVNGDGHPDVLFSNAREYSLHLFVPRAMLGFPPGWSRAVQSGRRGERADEIPMIVRAGPHPDNGAWFHAQCLWVQNEDTAAKPDLVERRSFKELMAGGLPPALSPAEALAAMRPRPGFQVELVAAEPMTKSPIAFDWGADGKLWVVEMGDYPLGTDGKGKPGGVVRFLESTHGDGHYDRSTVFLDGLPFPTGIIAWGKGVIVCDPPEIFYAEDTDGDGRADKRVKLFTGFGEGNQQHRANGFDYGLDNWLHGANGNSAGVIRSVLTGQTVDIRGRDFRFRPATGAFETQAGQTQYGTHRDDWGNWFGIENASPAWHYYPPEEYLARNPQLAVRTSKHLLPDYESATRVFPASRLAQRFNDPASGANHLTSANSVTPYRDELFGPGFAHSYFVSEPVHNLIHREDLVAAGVSFTSRRAPDEQTNEFLASTDNWFRPTMTKTGPDGALYVADMYRLVIEHPEWIPEDSQRSLDVRAGADKGRIYRIYPTNVVLRPMPRLDRLDTAGLVAALDSANGWQRDTAQRLLVAANDASSVPPLNALVRTSPRAVTRLQALATLDGLQAATPPVLTAALRDPHPSVRELALRLAGPRWADQSEPGLRAAAVRLTNDPSLRVRCQLAFTLGEVPPGEASRVLAELALQNLGAPDVLTAVYASAPKHLDRLVLTVLQEGDAAARQAILPPLAGFALALGQDAALVRCLAAARQDEARRYEPWQFALLAAWLDGLHRQGRTPAQFEADHPQLGNLARRFGDVLTQARITAADATATEAERLPAIQLLGLGFGGEAPDWATLAGLLTPATPPALRTAALGVLAGRAEPRAADALVAAWSTGGPELREGILAALLGRMESVEVLLAALEAGKISPGAIGPVAQQRLREYPRPKLRQRALQLFAAVGRDRGAVLQRYAGVGELTGDVARGVVYFRQACTPCHQVNDEGRPVGPDLGSVAFKPVDYLVTAILDPNQTFETRYTAYRAVDRSGNETIGILAAESANSVTLRQAGGMEVVFLRSDLRDLASLDRSLMPEGLETALDPQALADLVAFLRGTTPAKVFPGNHPVLVSPAADGAFRLRAAQGRVMGDTLVFEAQYGNLGYWNSPNDRVVWTVNVPQAGDYAVWLDWALQPGGASNRWVLTSGTAELTAAIPATASWDDYQHRAFGQLHLAAGRQTLELRPAAGAEGSLMDLRELRLLPAGRSTLPR